MANARIIGISVAGIAIALFVILMLTFSFVRRINTDEVALSYNLLTKRLGQSPLTAGLHFGSPGFTLIRFPSVFTSMQFDDISCLNEDGVTINIDVTLQYKAEPSHLYDIVIQFENHKGYKKILHSSGEAAIHDTCAHFNTTAFQSMRGFFQVKLLENMKKSMTAFYAVLRDLQVNNVRRPQEFEAAVKDKEAAKENIKIAENERPKLLTQARTEYQKALKQAQIINERADTDSIIIRNQASVEAETIRTKYSKETESYAELKRRMRFSPEALLAYMGVQVIGSSKNDIYVNLKSPAQVKYDL